MTKVKIPAPHLLASDLQQVTNHTVPQFCHLLNGNNSAYYLKGLLQELSDLFLGIKITTIRQCFPAPQFCSVFKNSTKPCDSKTSLMITFLRLKFKSNGFRKTLHPTIWF